MAKGGNGVKNFKDWDDLIYGLPCMHVHFEQKKYLSGGSDTERKTFKKDNKVLGKMIF